MSEAETKFKQVIRDLHAEGVYPGHSAINRRLGRTGRLNNLSGRETRWRREMFAELGITLQRALAT